MFGIESAQLWLFVQLLPEFFILGIGLTLMFRYLTGEDVDLFMTREEAMAPYSTSGGYGPALAAAIPAILFGIGIEILMVSVLYLNALLSPSFGVSQFQLFSTIAIMIGASFAYWGYLVCQTWIRESPVYRGWA